MLSLLDDPYSKALTVGRDTQVFKSISCLEFSPSGRYLVVGGDDGELRVLETSTGEAIYATSLDAGVTTVLWHPQVNKDLFVGTSKGAYLIHNFEVEGHSIFTGLTGPVYAMAFEPRQGLLATGISDEVHVTRRLENLPGYVTAVILPRPEQLQGIADDRIRVRSMHFIHKGRQLIVSYLAHGIVCWDIKTAKSVWRIIPDHDNKLVGFTAMSPDSRYILVSNLTDGVDLYETGKSHILRSFKYQMASSDNNFPLMPCFLHGGKSVICGSLMEEIKIWKTRSGDLVGTLLHDGKPIQFVSVAEGYTNRFIATACVEGKDKSFVTIWKARKGHRLAQLITSLIPTITARELCASIIITVVAYLLYACTQPPMYDKIQTLIKGIQEPAAAVGAVTHAWLVRILRTGTSTLHMCAVRLTVQILELLTLRGEGGFFMLD